MLTGSSPWQGRDEDFRTGSGQTKESSSRGPGSNHQLMQAYLRDVARAPVSHRLTSFPSLKSVDHVSFKLRTNHYGSQLIRREEPCAHSAYRDRDRRAGGCTKLLLPRSDGTSI